MREYKGLCTETEATIKENRDFVRYLKEALDEVAAMDATEPKSKRRNKFFCPSCGKKV